jgi:hypothetical protein
MYARFLGCEKVPLGPKSKLIKGKAEGAGPYFPPESLAADEIALADTQFRTR